MIQTGRTEEGAALRGGVLGWSQHCGSVSAVEWVWSCAIRAQHSSSHGTCSTVRNSPVIKATLDWLNWRKSTFPYGLKNTHLSIKFLLYLKHLIAFTLMNMGCKCTVCWWVMVWVGLKWALSQCGCNQSWLHKALGIASPGLCAETGTLYCSMGTVHVSSRASGGFN